MENFGKGLPGSEQPGLSNLEFQWVRRLISENLGFHFPDTKRFQVGRALMDRLKEKKLASFNEYINLLKKCSKEDPEWKALSNKLSIRETSFFRNPAQFGVLKDVIIPRLVQERGAGSKRIRIWSAGCSTGQEPYSIGMVLSSAIPAMLNPRLP